MNNIQNSIKKEYIGSLFELLTVCNLLEVKVQSIHYKFGGFIVIFEGFDNADAILHNGSHGNDNGEWETIGFPWDNGDVSIHDAHTLVTMISVLKNGGDWKEIEEIKEGDKEKSQKLQVAQKERMNQNGR